jgi:hypothetical protein
VRTRKWRLLTTLRSVLTWRLARSTATKCRLDDGSGGCVERADAVANRRVKARRRRRETAAHRRLRRASEGEPRALPFGALAAAPLARRVSLRARRRRQERAPAARLPPRRDPPGRRDAGQRSGLRTRAAAGRIRDLGGDPQPARRRRRRERPGRPRRGRLGGDERLRAGMLVGVRSALVRRDPRADARPGGRGARDHPLPRAERPLRARPPQRDDRTPAGQSRLLADLRGGRGIRHTGCLPRRQHPGVSQHHGCR